MSGAGELAELKSRTIWRTLQSVSKRSPDRDALVAADDVGNVQRLSYGRLAEHDAVLSPRRQHLGDHDGERRHAGFHGSIQLLEDVVASYDAVAACAAAGIADQRKGEAVRAYITLRPRQTLERDKLYAWFETRLARFKLPKEIVFVENLPRLANGKLDRVRLSGWAKDEVAS